MPTKTTFTFVSALTLLCVSAPCLAVDAATDFEIALTPGAGLTLEQAMDQAEAHDYGVKISQATMREARSRSSQSTGQMGPKLSAEGNAIWFDKDVNKMTGTTLPNGTEIPERITTAALVLTQPILGLGPLWLRTKAESLNGDIAETDAAQASLDARLRGAEAYIRASKAQRFLQITQSSLGVIDKQRRDASLLKRQGKLADSDLIRFDFAQSDAKTQLVQARSMANSAAAYLIEVLGLPRRAQRIELRSDAHQGWALKNQTLAPLEQLLAEGEAQRSDIKAAQKRVEAAGFAKSATTYDFIPSLNAFARYERDFQAEDKSLPLAGQSSTLDYKKEEIRDKFSYGLQASWTIWDWGSRRNRRAEFVATMDKAKAMEDATSSKAHVEIVQSYMELRSAIEALESSQASARLGQEVYRTTSLKFANGLSTTTDVLTAERDQARALLALANAEGDADFAWLKLKKVVGTNPTLKSPTK